MRTDRRKQGVSLPRAHIPGPRWPPASLRGALLPVGGLLLLWLVLRVPELTAWTETFRPTLEYDSANAARTMWFALRPEALDAWQRAWLDAHPGRLIEPPFLQFLTVLTYLPDGVERPWTSALFTSAAWLVAGILVFDVARRRASVLGGAVALAYFLFAPFGLAISRSFQVDGLAVLGLAATAWYAERSDFLSSPRRFVTMVLVAGVAGVLKPGPLLPMIAGALVAFGVERGTVPSHPRRAVLLALVVGLAILPAVAYALLMLRDQVGPKLIPDLLLTRAFYDGWLLNATRVAGSALLVAAVLGFALAPRLRALGLGLTAGYLVTSLSFTWHTMTHDYYQVPLLLIVALGLAGFVSAAERMASGKTLAVGIAMLASVTASIVLMHLPAPPEAASTSGALLRHDAPIFAALARRIGPGEPILAYSYNYGFPLMYYSHLVVSSWPTAGDLRLEAAQGISEPAAQRLAGARAAGIRYFVITDGISGGSGVRSFLDSRAALDCSGDGVWVYDLDAAAGSLGDAPGPCRPG